ncbi:redoxin [Micromonospora sp. Llam0]|uniref:TlpA family protein disulfide reductase n=1 Tax=Micromonospora sp. Llam0 TaxID=2485143 RepID=UPI000FB604D8|nr:redoxin family protein [Micromonospora sp. Llam0]ROO62772.1 redoxin [Micromonospora sp. Llam0]
MTYVVASVVLIGAISLINLSLTAAVIRRLRQDQSAPVNSAPVSGLAVGSSLPDLTTTALDGAEVSVARVGQEQAVFAFISTGCSACGPSIPHFIEYVRSQSLRQSQAIAVIAGERENATHFIEQLGGIATTVLDSKEGDFARSFAVFAFPTFIASDSAGRVIASGAGAASLPRER